MLSKMGGINSIYGYQSSVNQMKLAQIVKKSTQEDNSASRQVSKSRTDNQFIKESLSYVSDYSSAMTNLMSSANSLRGNNGGSAVNQLEASSSDTSVLSAQKNYKLRNAGSYDINVTQLAAAQTNVSNAVKSAGTASSDINMEINSGKGSVSIAVSSTDSNGIQKSNSQMLSETAKAINEAGIGVKASIVTKDGSSSLQLTADKTGEKGKFEVKGDYAEKNGLSNVSQQAQNANYSVTKNGVTSSYSSESNNVSLELGKIDINLKNTGSSTVTVGTDTNKMVSAMEDLVASYNQAVKLITKNSDRGSGNNRQLSKLSRVLGSSQEQELLGLKKAKDGTITLDKSKLESNLKTQPGLTKDAISGPFSLAQRAFNSAQTGLSSSVESLIKNDLKEAENSYASSPVNIFNSLSRSGSYNMMNYFTVGTLFNFHA